jgi:DNA replication factor GINS
MGLDDLRNILLSERETGKLVSIAPDIFDHTHTEIAALLVKVYAIEDPLSEEARALIEETMAIKETMHDLFSIRSRKILALTIMHAEGNYYDREEVKRMIPAEKAMFEEITSSIEECQGVLLRNVPAVARAVSVPPARVLEEEFEDAGEPAPFLEEEPAVLPPGPQIAEAPLTHPCALVRVLSDMDSFMGVDGRIYTLSKGDIVTLPERNAAVLSERNIVLNMNLCK